MQSFTFLFYSRCTHQAYLLVLVSMLALPTIIRAAELNELQEGLPLSIEDAVPVQQGEIELHGVLQYQRVRSDQPNAGRNEFELRPQLEIGIARNVQMSLFAPYRTGNASQSSQGDLRIEGMYQFNEEGGGMPALSMAAGVEQPCGSGSGGTEVTFKVLMTKSFEPLFQPFLSLKVHLNLTVHHNVNPEGSERTNRYKVGAAYSEPIDERCTIWPISLSFRAQ